MFALAPSAWASANCPNEQFRTGLGANLPNCRAYEQVSPPDKKGGSVDGGIVLETEPAPQQTSTNGESVTFASQTVFNETNAQSAPASLQYIATRGPQGWHTIAVDPPQEYPFGRISLELGNVDESPFQGFSEDLAHGYLDAANPQPVVGAPEGHYNPYLRNDATSSYTLLAGVGPPTSTPEEPNTESGSGIAVLYAGMSSDGKRAIFMANGALTPEAIAGKTNLYEWNEGTLELVSVLPDGEPDAGGTPADSESGLVYGGEVNEAQQGAKWDFAHAFSNDGRRAFWKGSNGRLYMHEPTGLGARTAEVSASQRTGATPETGSYAQFWTTSADGSLVYFTSCEKLTDDSTAVEGGERSLCMNQGRDGFGQDLYQYNVNTGKLTDISVDPNAGHTASVQGVLGASSDGSYVYFAAKGALAEGAIQADGIENENAETFNIYLWHDGVTQLITTLAREAGAGEQGTYNEEAAWDRATNRHISRVSPNGRYLAFESAKPLTANAITTPSTPDGCTRAQGGEENFEDSALVQRIDEGGRRCIQVYLYDSETGKLACASCSSDGFPPTGNSIVPNGVTVGEPSMGWESTTQQQRYLLNNGMLFFDSTVGLVPQDTNGKEDVYEYQPAGVGDCSGSFACLSLLSAGTSPIRSQFIDSDSEGNNVFIDTSDRLVASDIDEAADIYGVRVDGGFASQSALPCSGEACKPAVSSPPSIYGAPASQAFGGSGNTVEQSSAVKPKPKKKPVKKKPVKKQRVKKKASKSRARRSRVRHGKGRGK